MVKEPRPGRVKTRLGRDIGMTAAAWWYRHQVRRLLRRLRDPRWDLVLAVSPDRDGLASRIWPSDLRRWPQGDGDLGARMARALTGQGAGPGVLVGSDIPGIGRSQIARAFTALRGADAVVGPSPDGGYWLIGIRDRARLPSHAFREVRWSGPLALADTLSSLGPLRIARVDTLADVDVAADLAAG